jgi:hypothetical protein
MLSADQRASGELCVTLVQLAYVPSCEQDASCSLDSFAGAGCLGLPITFTTWPFIVGVQVTYFSVMLLYLWLSSFMDKVSSIN